MQVALRDTYVEVVFYSGPVDRYPPWFEKEVLDNIIECESRYTYWVHEHERTAEYYEKAVVADYSVFLRKETGEIYMTDYDTFVDLYLLYKHNAMTNSGVAALKEDSIEFVECKGGVVNESYPPWFLEFCTECINFPEESQTIYTLDTSYKDIGNVCTFISSNEDGDITISEHSVFLRNKLGEIRGMTYDMFIKYYDPDPVVDIWSALSFLKYHPKL